MSSRQKGHHMTILSKRLKVSMIFLHPLHQTLFVHLGHFLSQDLHKILGDILIFANHGRCSRTKFHTPGDNSNLSDLVLLI